MVSHRSGVKPCVVGLLLLLVAARFGITDGQWRLIEKFVPASLWSEGDAKPAPASGHDGDQGPCGPGNCDGQESQDYADYPETQGFVRPKHPIPEQPLTRDIIFEQTRDTEDAASQQDGDGAGNPRAIKTDEGEEVCPIGDQGEGACPTGDQGEGACPIVDQEDTDTQTSALTRREDEECGIACNLKKVASTAVSTVTVATDFFSDQMYRKAYRKASNYTKEFAETVRGVFHQELYGFFELLVEKMGHILSSDALVMMLFKNLSRRILSASLIIAFVLIDYFLSYFCSFFFILALDGFVFLLHYLKGPVWVYSKLYVILVYVYDLLIFIVSYPKLAAFFIVLLFLASIIYPIVRWSLRRNMHYKIDSIERCVTRMERAMRRMEDRQDEVLQRLEERQNEVLQKIEEKQDKFLQRIEAKQDELLERIEEKQKSLLHCLETTQLLSTRNGLLGATNSA